MKRQTIYIYGSMVLAALLSACSSNLDEVGMDTPEWKSFTVKSQLLPMEGEPQTRISIDGTKFLKDDMIRLKMVTPYDHSTSQKHDPEFGESTWGGTVDNYFLLRCTGAGTGNGWTDWSTSGFKAEDNLDLNGDGHVGNTSAPDLQHLSQQTPYVYTANTWNRTVGFQTASQWRTIYKSTFYADQSIEANFRASDLLWAQTMTQTCTDEVTLSFHHVLSELLITIPDGMSNAIVTLTHMPNVDQQEFVVGDKYANTYYDSGDMLSFSKISYVGEGSANGTADDNGKVIGISKIKDDAYQLTKLSAINDNTGIYVAYKEKANTFRVIVPPMTIDNDATIVLRDVDSNGNAKKYIYKLKNEITDLTSNTFEANKCYPITLKVKEEAKEPYKEKED